MSGYFLLIAAAYVPIMACGIWAARICRRKGRAPALGWFLGMAGGTLTLLIEGFIPGTMVGYSIPGGGLVRIVVVLSQPFGLVGVAIASRLAPSRTRN